jgi:16S rRNA (guanine966-N2)-methyltransferase
VPKGLPVRPTTDFAKTGLFSILRSRYDLETLRCLDLFSGTGSISLELASEGCKDITAVDSSDKCVGFQKATHASLGESGIKSVRSDVFQWLRRCTWTFDLIFADPPFDAKEKIAIWEAILIRKLLNKNGVFILEHQSRENYEGTTGYGFTRKYGNVAFTFFFNFDPETPLA